MTFFNKPYDKWSKVEKPVPVYMHSEGSDNDEVVETVLTHNENNDKVLVLVWRYYVQLRYCPHKYTRDQI